MATKENPGSFDCYERAEPKEEYFMLLARDSLAAQLVELWCVRRQAGIAGGIRPDTPQERAQIEEARGAAERMRSQCEERRAAKNAALAQGAAEPAESTA
ncbi:MAG: hypothetical protein ACREEP_04360 [Dongiaceae bacterium]